MKKVKDFLSTLIGGAVLFLPIILVVIGIVFAVFTDDSDKRASAHLPAYHTTTQNTTYILNTSTHKFHKPNCGAVRQMDDSNIWEFTGTRQQVINMGYEACGRCGP